MSGTLGEPGDEAERRERLSPVPAGVRRSRREEDPAEGTEKGASDAGGSPEGHGSLWEQVQQKSRKMRTEGPSVSRNVKVT